MKNEFCILIDSAVEIIKKNIKIDEYCDYVERYQNIIIELEDLKKAYLDNRLFKKFFNLNVVHMVEENIDNRELIKAIDDINKYYIENIAEE